MQSEVETATLPMSQKLPRRELILATAGVMLCLLLVSLDQTIVGTAMPRIIAELQGLSYYAWVTTAYLVTSTVLVPVAGKLGDMFGRKPFLLAGMIGFVAASMLCGLSQNMLELVLFRGLQGLFGGMLFASVFAVLADIFPIEQRTRMQGLFGAVFGLSSVIGPTVGGYLTDGPGWRWVFYVNVPVGVLAVLAVTMGLPYVRSRAQLRDIDWLGCLTLTAGLIPMLIAFSITRDHAWSSPEVMGLLAFAAVALATFFLIERRAENPVVPFGLFKNNVFAVCVLISFLSALGMFGVIIFVPLLYQGVLAASATNSGQLLTPMMLGLIVFSTLAGQIMTRIRYYRFLGTGGIVLMIVGMLLLAQVGIHTDRWRVALDIVIIGAGLGVTFPLTFAAVQSAVPREVLGVVTSQVQFWRNLGGTIGTAILGSILAQRLPGAISAQIASLKLPPLLRVPTGSSGSPQAIFDPGNLAHERAALPPQAAPLFDRFIEAIRTALATTLHELFLVSAVILVLALLATLFLREVPLRSARQPSGEASAPEAQGSKEEEPPQQAATA
ncbi:MAG TPA: MDR family MFS transporter [Candidatus Dormibacteraeota bacterium]|nr:MDR family MFS transporter [Candidatus Dormibacteraeota bacterium]